ncbi:hypothetical protein H0O02_05045 [Candidatus Micrarchaeota archaeon]|nr:hypothetical protein [Candidatus Micrarchaeota archaeon]
MIPEAKLIKSEIMIRELSLPDDVLLARKSIVRWLALSLGLIMPNESRTLLLDIFDVLLEFHAKGVSPTTKEIIDRLEAPGGEKQNPKAVYYHLQRLTNMGILTRNKGKYYFGDGDGKSMPDVFRDFYKNKSDSAFGNIEKALRKLENGYRQ